MDSIIRLIHEIWTNLQAGVIPNFGFWNYILLALFVAIEGPIATLIGAAAASAGIMHLDLVFLFASIGNLTADSLWYSLGRAGKIEWLLHYGRWFGVQKHHLETLNRGMHEHAAKILLIAKVTAGLIIPTLIAAGLAKVPWKRWFPAVALGEMFWTGSLVLIGYYTTESIRQLEHDLRYLGITISLIMLIGLIYLVRRQLLNQKNANEDSS